MDEFFHNHPFNFYTFVISGWYKEEILDYNGNGGYVSRVNLMQEGQSQFVSANRIHKIVEMCSAGCLTIITPKHWQQEPCFFRPSGTGLEVRQWDETEWRPYEPGR